MAMRWYDKASAKAQYTDRITASLGSSLPALSQWQWQLPSGTTLVMALSLRLNYTSFGASTSAIRFEWNVYLAQCKSSIRTSKSVSFSKLMTCNRIELFPKFEGDDTTHAFKDKHSLWTAPSATLAFWGWNGQPGQCELRFGAKKINNK